MNVASFSNLLSLLGNDICVDESRSIVSGVEPTAPEIRDDPTLDIRNIAEISVASIYRVIHLAITTIISGRTLDMNFPKTSRKLFWSAANFTLCSSHDVVSGCIGCVDGMLVRIKAPSSKETGNVFSYFSGRYQGAGVNVQAV
ncbi:hypothetical protein GN958_ATG18137 [Phytophthora infestans]|uniref:DDE Tnp4 domain-containing protein n=1 Tax=Phytophthora infestans TaxID=4787 RepID=A0A8S9TV50_PHYIN|nr:hypothetical protein GN958_ATG18137 [Phytophthora infestans]